MNHIVLITGLGSSIPWFGYFWTRWARKLQKRLEKFYALRKDVTIHRVSADGRFERKAFDAIRADRRKGRLGDIAIVGHSNGFRDGLRQAEALYPHTPIRYFAGIDMTLGEFGALAYGNIEYLDEFHGVLQRADFHASFRQNKRIHRYQETKAAHTASASLPWVQNHIFKQIVERMS